MKRKNAIILGSISLISLSLVGGILLTSNSSNYLKASAETEYTITLTKNNISDVSGEGNYKTFSLVGQTGKLHVEYTTETCTISSSSDQDFTIGGDHLFTMDFSHYGYVQIQAGLLDTGELIDCYMVGKTGGEVNNHIHQDSWIEGEPGIYLIDIYLNKSQLSWLTTMEVDQIVFKYMC